ncbi:MIB [Acanthosepion pharaonis]|uniref:MIB n=1 Tax=Acanthosepion pharaonis TaxID=158019 RepID=A0A812DJP7_ACAPH|nr:MIB [Sepia pharaonis]
MKNEKVHVKFEDEQYSFLPEMLTKAFACDEEVKLLEDIELVKSLQEDHGGWNEDMRKIIGKTGKVVQIETQHISVKFDTKIWHINPMACVGLKKPNLDISEDIKNTKCCVNCHETTDDVLQLQHCSVYNWCRFIYPIVRPHLDWFDLAERHLAKTHVASLRSNSQRGQRSSLWVESTQRLASSYIPCRCRRRIRSGTRNLRGLVPGRPIQCRGAVTATAIDKPLLTTDDDVHTYESIFWKVKAKKWDRTSKFYKELLKWKLVTLLLSTWKKTLCK